jgi:hypothetical protein
MTRFRLGAAIVTAAFLSSAASTSPASLLTLPQGLEDAIANADSVEVSVAYQGDTFPWSMMGAGIGYSNPMSPATRQKFAALLARQGAFAPPTCCVVCGDRCDRHRYRVSLYRQSVRTTQLFVGAEEQVLVASDSSERFSASFAPVGEEVSALLRETIPGDSSAVVAPAGNRSTGSLVHPRLDDWFVGEQPPRVTSGGTARFPNGLDGLPDSTIVLAWALIDSTGYVRETLLIGGNANRRLLPATRAALRTWGFEAARCAGRRVAAWAALAVVFTRK